MNKKVKNKKRRHIHIFRLLFVLTILFCIIFGIYKTVSLLFPEKTINTFSSLQGNQTQSIYSYKKDGYSSTFSISANSYSKNYKEFKQDHNTPWSTKPYWGGTMAKNGCGITSIAIIASGYNLDTTPETLRELYYPHLDAENIYQAISDLGIKCTDFYFSNIYLNEKYITEWLETNRPILICVDNTHKNPWTKASHYMVLLATNNNGEIYVSNPNGKEGTENASGWYDADEILPYVVKALFIESYI